MGRVAVRASASGTSRRRAARIVCPSRHAAVGSAIVSRRRPRVRARCRPVRRDRARAGSDVASRRARGAAARRRRGGRRRERRRPARRTRRRGHGRRCARRLVPPPSEARCRRREQRLALDADEHVVPSAPHTSTTRSRRAACRDRRAEPRRVGAGTGREVRGEPTKRDPGASGFGPDHGHALGQGGGSDAGRRRDRMAGARLRVEVVVGCTRGAHAERLLPRRRRAVAERGQFVRIVRKELQRRADAEEAYDRRTAVR